MGNSAAFAKNHMHLCISRFTWTCLEAEKCWEAFQKKHKHTHTLMDMRTDLTAVPHAGLEFHFLREHVRTTGSGRSSRGSRAQKEENERRTNRLTTFRSHLQFKGNINSSSLRGSWLSLLPFGKGKCRYVQSASRLHITANLKCLR